MFMPSAMGAMGVNPYSTTTAANNSWMNDLGAGGVGGLSQHDHLSDN